ncbi:MAG: CDP-diacylglycerol--glycerol-3-phosphate 3-phosphatidyltransferase [Pseudomonadota bacterium]
MDQTAQPSVPLLTLPNLLTLSRIACVLPIALLLLPEEGWARWSAFALMVVASLTDWADGYLARRRAQVSPLGRFLDPIADKLLVVAVLIVLLAIGDLSGWETLGVIAILSREILISGLREYMSGEGVTVHVTKLAKWKTTVQLAAVALLILVPVLTPIWGAWVPWAAGAVFWLSAVLTVITGWDYVKGGLAHMRLAPKPPQD